ncbi:CPK1, partial [Symbiodinium necroappetens]
HAAKIEEHFRCHLPVSFPAQRARQLKPQFQSETWVYWARWRQDAPGNAAQLIKAYLHEVAVQATRDSTSCIVQRLRQLTGGPKRKQRGAMPLPAVELKTGQLAATHAEAKERWIEHFAAIEDGGKEDPTEFVHACYKRQAAKDLSCHVLDVQDIPCRTELEAALRAASTDRAYGLDDIPGEVLRFGAPELSRGVYALLLKSVFRLTEPVQHKGGTLYCIWKGKGRCSGPLASAAVPLQGTMHDLRAFLGGDPLLASAGSSAWASGAVNESLYDTWFRLPQEDDLIVTHTGSRPGDSLSDLVFSFLFSRVLRRVRDALTQAGALARVPWNPAMEYNIEPTVAVRGTSLGVSDATWMDDLAMFFTSPDAFSLLRDLKFGASALIDSCLQRALVPNLSRGKTEAIVHLSGAGAQKVRTSIFGDDGGHVPLSCSLWAEARLRAVPVYKHLGGYLQHNGGLKQEISYRLSQAWDAFNKRKKRLFQSPLVSSEDKSIFFTSLISTVMFHGAGTWTQIMERHCASLDAALRQMACQMLHPRISVTDAWHMGASQALALAGVPHAATYLHVARLRHLLACMQLKVPEIWALAHWEQHWLEAVRGSVRWLWSLVDAGRYHTDDRSAWGVWQTECQEHPGKWKAKLRRALAKALQRERWEATLEQHAGLITRQLKFGGAVMPQCFGAAVPQKEVCACCGIVFKDFRAWSVHAFKRHGRTDEVRSLVEGLQCPQCLRHFATHVRLCRHLRHSATCRRPLLSNSHRNAPVPGIGSRKAPKEHLFCAPTLQAAGPKTFVIGDPVEDEVDRPAAEVLDCLDLLDFDGLGTHFDPDTIWNRIRQAFSCVCLPVRRLQVTAQVWMERLQRDEGLGDDNLRLKAFLEKAANWVVHADFAEWLVPAPDERRELEFFTAEVQECGFFLSTCGLPVPFVELFAKHQDVVKRLTDRTSALLRTLLDGLVWRSQRTEANGTLRRVNYFVKYVLEDAKGKFSPSLKNISASGDPSIVSHPLVSVVVELLWAGVVRRQFMVSRIWNILNLIIFVMGQEITPSMIRNNGPSNELYSLLFFFRMFSYIVGMGRLLMLQLHRVWIWSRDTMRRIIADIDTDGNGEIDYEEMKEALSRFKDTVKGEIRKALKVLRNDEDLEEMNSDKKDLANQGAWKKCDRSKCFALRHGRTERPCFTGKLDIFVAGGYDYERFIFHQHALRLGVDDALECCTQAEFRAALFKSQRCNKELPLVVFLGSETWVEDLKKYDLSQRPPFVVNIDARAVKNPDAYNEHLLSSCTRDEVAALLSRVVDCRNQSDNQSAGASAS